MGGKALNGKQITNEEAHQLFDKLLTENNLGCKTQKILLCGSARRGKGKCGDLDIVFIDGGEEENLLKEWLVDNYGVKKNGKPQTTILYEGVQVEFYEATQESWGSNVLMWTGSAFNNVRLRRKAKKLGLKLSQHGLFNEQGDNVAAGMTENDIYEYLGYDYIEPQKR